MSDTNLESLAEDLKAAGHVLRAAAFSRKDLSLCADEDEMRMVDVIETALDTVGEAELKLREMNAPDETGRVVERRAFYQAYRTFFDEDGGRGHWLSDECNTYDEAEALLAVNRPSLALRGVKHKDVVLYVEQAARECLPGD